MSESQGPEGTTGTESTEGTTSTTGTEDTQRLPVMEKAADAPAQATSAAAYDPLPSPDSENGDERRLWSARRVPAGVLALLIAAVAGLFLYDIAAVRADRPAMRWRGTLARQLAERPLDDLWVLVGAAVAVALGIGLLVLAATPGLRDVLPMRRVHTGVRAGLHRGAAAMVLRDRAMEVSGVRTVRVHVGRRKVEVRAVAHFRELDEVRADLDATLAVGIRRLGLSRPLAPAVHVRRPARKG